MTAPSISLTEQMLRRRPVIGAPVAHGAADHLERKYRHVPADDVRCRRDRRHRHLLRAVRGGAGGRPGGDHLVPHRGHRGRALGDLLRRNGLGGAGIGVDLLLRLHDAGRVRRDGRRGLSAAGVRRVHLRGGGRMERISEQAAGQPVRCADPARAVGRSVGRRPGHGQSAGDHPDRHVCAAADSRRQRVRHGQHHHGDHQAGRAGDVHRDRVHRVQHRPFAGFGLGRRRDQRGGGHDLLLLHRPGRRLHRR